MSYNILYDDESGICDRLNSFFNDWRIQVQLLDNNVFLVDRSFTNCHNMYNLCECLNITESERRVCVSDIKVSKDIHYNFCVNLGLLKKMRRLNKGGVV